MTCCSSVAAPAATASDFSSSRTYSYMSASCAAGASSWSWSCSVYYSVYLLYWYNSTNTDVRRCGCVRLVLVLQHSCVSICTFVLASTCFCTSKHVLLC